MCVKRSRSCPPSYLPHKEHRAKCASARERDLTSEPAIVYWIYGDYLRVGPDDTQQNESSKICHAINCMTLRYGSMIYARPVHGGVFCIIIKPPLRQLSGVGVEFNRAVVQPIPKPPTNGGGRLLCLQQTCKTENARSGAPFHRAPCTVLCSNQHTLAHNPACAVVDRLAFCSFAVR